jgi:polyphosphate kinase 2 (PPK2 family)
LLGENGTTVLKFFLHITKDEQKERLEKRLSDPAKRRKFNAADLDVRKRWDAYMAPYEEAIEHCSDAAPWHIVPADRKWYRNIFVARSVHKALEELDPSYPDLRADFAGLSIEG